MYLTWPSNIMLCTVQCNIVLSTVQCPLLSHLLTSRFLLVTMLELLISTFCPFVMTCRKSRATCLPLALLTVLAPIHDNLNSLNLQLSLTNSTWSYPFSVPILSLVSLLTLILAKLWEEKEVSCLFILWLGRLYLWALPDKGNWYVIGILIEGLYCLMNPQMLPFLINLLRHPSFWRGTKVVGFVLILFYLIMHHLTSLSPEVQPLDSQASPRPASPSWFLNLRLLMEVVIPSAALLIWNATGVSGTYSVSNLGSADDLDTSAGVGHPLCWFHQQWCSTRFL